MLLRIPPCAACSGKNEIDKIADELQLLLQVIQGGLCEIKIVTGLLNIFFILTRNNAFNLEILVINFRFAFLKEKLFF